MMTILPSANTPAVPEKRAFDSLNEPQSASKRTKSPSDLSAVRNTSDGRHTFSSKMIIQLAKTAIASLDNSSSSSSVKISSYEESPIQSLAHTISLPSSNPKAISSQNLSLLISQLTSEIARLDSSGALPLIHSILSVNWIHHSANHDGFSKHYATFLTVLVSTIPSWWNEVAAKIISDFTKSNEKTLQAHHETLKKLISLAPTSSTSLPSLLKSNFPNKSAPKDDIVNYVRNILHLSEYYTVLVNYVWSLVFENFIKLDVELQNHIDEVDDDDLAEALGLDDSDNEADASDEEGEDDEYDENEEGDDVSGSDNDNEDEEVDERGSGAKLNTVEDEIEESDDDDNDDDAEDSHDGSSKVIKKVAFTEETDKEDGEFDDEMLDSEAEYTIELESLSELSSKLDTLLSYLLAYLKPNLSIDSLESGQGIPTFSALTSAFRSMILPTHGTKATQYIIFYAAQQQPELIDAFLVSLFEIVFSADKKSSLAGSSFSSLSGSSSIGNTSNQHARVTGVQYIASFVARASKLSDTQIMSVVTFLVDYCTAYMEEHDDDDDDETDIKNATGRSKNNHKNGTDSSSRNNSSSGHDTKRKEFNPMKHTLFYSLVQALMYIVCFRKDSLREPDYPNGNSGLPAESNKGTGWVAALDKFFTRVIVSKYDPLRWCNETVVLIFSRLAQSESICYTWSVVERIRRERVGRVNSERHDNKKDKLESKDSNSAPGTNVTIGTQSSMRATQEFLDLVAFFPFDPLLLKKSRQIVQDTYVEWDNGDDDDNEESD